MIVKIIQGGLDGIVKMNYVRNYIHTGNADFLKFSSYSADNFELSYFKALQDSLKQSD